MGARELRVREELFGSLVCQQFQVLHSFDMSMQGDFCVGWKQELVCDRLRASQFHGVLFGGEHLELRMQEQLRMGYKRATMHDQLLQHLGCNAAEGLSRRVQVQWRQGVQQHRYALPGRFSCQQGVLQALGVGCPWSGNRLQ